MYLVILRGFGGGTRGGTGRIPLEARFLMKGIWASLALAMVREVWLRKLHSRTGLEVFPADVCGARRLSMKEYPGCLARLLVPNLQEERGCRDSELFDGETKVLPHQQGGYSASGVLAGASKMLGEGQ